MQPTTTYALAQAIRPAIEGITPSFEHERVCTWRYTPSPRTLGTANLFGADIRAFDLIFDPAIETNQWYGAGVAYTVRMRVVTSYAGVPPDLLDHMVSADGVDLTRLMHQLTEPTTPGMGCARYRLGPIRRDDQMNAVVEHHLEIPYAQAVP